MAVVTFLGYQGPGLAALSKFREIATSPVAGLDIQSDGFSIH